MTQSASTPPSWPQRRRMVLAGLGLAPQKICFAERDADLIAALLVKEGLIEPAEGGEHRITPAGRVLRAMHQLEGKSEGGPWGRTDLRTYAAVRQLDIATCDAALSSLETRGLIAAQPSKRTPRWDLTTK